MGKIAQTGNSLEIAQLGNKLKKLPKWANSYRLSPPPPNFNVDTYNVGQHVGAQDNPPTISSLRV